MTRVHARQALVLAGHGSLSDPRSAEPLYTHADRLRQRGWFAAVRAAFWKGLPSLAEVLGTVEADAVYVVPVMTSEGYFVDGVFPRELGLTDGRSPGDGPTVRYTEPVGTHERVADVVVERVDATGADAADGSGLGVALVGHGTERHERSGAATVAQVERLRERGRFDEVRALFLDQAPRVDDLPAHFGVDRVAVVPFFVADGHHVTRDVPRALGLPTGDDAFGGPTAVDGVSCWYTRAVGTAPGLTDVVAQRAADAGADVEAARGLVETGEAAGGPDPTGDVELDAAAGNPRAAEVAGWSGAERAFLRWLDRADGATGGDRTWGELSIAVATTDGGERRYDVRHRADRGTPAAELDRLSTPAAVRDRTARDDDGSYRPLRTARSLPTGWLAADLTARETLRTVRAVYPASVGLWHSERRGELDATSFRDAAARQSGRYAGLADVDGRTVARTAEACCGDCVRRRAWSAGGEVPAPLDGHGARPEGSFPCPEPCALLLERARSAAERCAPVRPAPDATH